MLILVQQTLIYRISNHVLGTAIIIQCTYQMKIGMVAPFFLYFVTKTWKIQFVLSFLSSIALGGTGTVFQDYFPIYFVLVFFRNFFPILNFLGWLQHLGQAEPERLAPRHVSEDRLNRTQCQRHEKDSSNRRDTGMVGR